MTGGPALAVVLQSGDVALVDECIWSLREVNGDPAEINALERHR